MTSEFQEHNHNWNQEGFTETAAENLWAPLTRSTRSPLVEGQTPKVCADRPPYAAYALSLDTARSGKEDLHVNKKTAQTDLYRHASDKS